MRRFWFLVAALAVVNIAAAAAVILFIPPAHAVSPSAGLQVPGNRPFFVVLPSRPQSFEGRVRSIARGEVLRLRPAAPGAVATDSVAAAQAERMLRPRAVAGVGPERPRPGFAVPVNEPPAEPAVLTPFGLFRAGIAGFGLAALSLGVLFASGALAVYLMPRRMRQVRSALGSGRRSVKAAVVGMLGYLLSLVALFVLIMLVTAAVVAPLVAVLLAAATLMGLGAVMLALGRGIAGRVAPGAAPHPLRDLLIGALALFPLSLIPWAGWIVVLIAAATGFGAAIITRFGSEHGWSIETYDGGTPAQPA